MTPVPRPRLYLAAPLFNVSERRFNLELCAALESHANVFLPQRDGLLLRDMIAQGIEPAAARRLVFDVDVGAIRECDVLLAVLDGRTIDEGVAFELGVAFALQKACLALKTDDRVLVASGDNPMIGEACRHTYRTIEALCASLERAPPGSVHLMETNWGEGCPDSYDRPSGLQMTRE